MLSVASLSSAAQAGSYYSKDNYYTAEDARATSEWAGEGAREMGLVGRVEVGAFEAALRGIAPDGTIVGEGSGKEHRPGMDMTFSAPKSLSLLAYVGGDERLLDANLEAVRKTIAWAEANLAEARVRSGGDLVREKTGNLVVALFSHDTNRNLDPQAHVHAVIANMTRTADGAWRALTNDQLWKQNTLLGAIYHSYLRQGVEKLGYETEDAGKHGTFEIRGVPRDAIEAFSTRRQEVLARAGELGLESPQARDAVTIRTREAKQVVEDRAALKAAWVERAREVGIDLAPVLEAARAREREGNSLVGRLVTGARSVAEEVRTLFGIARNDPEAARPYYLAPHRGAGKEASAAAVAVAAAIRHLSERETSFTGFDVARAALNLGIGTTIDRVEAQLGRLEKRGMVILGKGDGRYTTPEGIAVERRLLEQAERGRGAGDAIIRDPHLAGDRVQAVAMDLRGFTLNQGQEGAARLLLASRDRIVNVQGVAGAGKSSVLQPVAEIARSEGRQVLALGVQNKLVAQLRNDTGIEAMTVARFLSTHGRLLGDRADPERLALTRTMFRGAVLIVDEASMLSNAQAERLAALANRLEVGRLAFVGDGRQLGAVEAGKPFELLQAGAVPTAAMTENIRARSADLREAAAKAHAGDIRGAFEALANRVRPSPGQMGERGAADWLSRSPKDRERTIVMTSGRRLMREVNERIQDRLLAEGTLRGEGHETQVRDRVQATREEMRTPGFYQTGMILEVRRDIGRGADRLGAGDYAVVGVDRVSRQVLVRDADGRVWPIDVRRLGDRTDDQLRLSTERALKLHEGDRIRWTDNDRDRGLFNADRAKVVGITEKSITIENSAGIRIEMPKTDPMLKKLDLAYAMNTHQLQGATADRVIAIADSRETNLATAKLFLVNITRPRDDLVLYVDDAARYARNIARNPGEKSSALQTLGELAPARSAIMPGAPVVAPSPKPPEPARQVPVKQRDLEISP
jgi:conjugative relaxase-like TrwC/TraI family protein